MAASTTSLDSREPAVTRPDIVAGLRRVGVAAGDVVFAHSSLSAFGWVKGGVDTVVEAMLERPIAIAALLVESGLAYPTSPVFGDDGFPKLSAEISKRAIPPEFCAPWRWRRLHRREIGPVDGATGE